MLSDSEASRFTAYVRNDTTRSFLRQDDTTAEIRLSFESQVVRLEHGGDTAVSSIVPATRHLRPLRFLPPPAVRLPHDSRLRTSVSSTPRHLDCSTYSRLPTSS